MELVQFGAGWCQPCGRAKDFIERNFDKNLFAYKYVDIQNLEDVPQRYIDMMNTVKVRSIPTFICVENENDIVLQFHGFDQQLISKCISYMIKETLDNSSVEIKDSVSIEEWEAIQKKYFEILTNQTDIFSNNEDLTPKPDLNNLLGSGDSEDDDDEYNIDFFSDEGSSDDD